ncbi:MAG: MotA/TolQ/ExbB proton channel family protein [Parachlamydiales bacterium]
MVQVLASNPFLSSYTGSDLFGKLIILSLLFVSALSWAILVYKFRYARGITHSGNQFLDRFQKSLNNPLNFDFPQKKSHPNSFLEVYRALKRVAVEILNKNQSHSPEMGGAYLSSADIESVAFQVEAQIQRERERFERHLAWLATTVSLAPFLGLLGTVWGILLTFSELQNLGAGSGSPLVMGGLSMALATTVLGLVIAIPALIGHNLLKARVRSFEAQMRAFATQAIGAIELQYRRVEL